MKPTSRFEHQLVSFFLNPQNYPHTVPSVRHYETHISHVFLAGKYAYKIKKPVKFDFLDASTLTLRKKWCRLEVRLNRRLARSMYLGIVPISRIHHRLCIGRGKRIVEWAVKMRRLPQALMLDRMITRKRVTFKEIRCLTEKWIQFFRAAPRLKSSGSYGKPALVKQTVLENLRQCEKVMPHLTEEIDWDFFEGAFRQYLALHEPLFWRRIYEHKIIDGHGDLRSENICMTDPITIFDCVEFEPAFRRGDLANDLAFLLMDLEVRGRSDLAKAALKYYRKRTKDRSAENILPFYQCHRSLVRGKVRALAWLQHPRSAEGKRMHALALRHFRFARSYAHRFSRPLLIVVGGLIGTGKSTLARQLAEQLGATWLRTDEIRLKEFVPFCPSGRGFEKGLYSSQVSKQVYRRLFGRADNLLQRGYSVVCDGTFSKNQGRTTLKRIAKRCGASFHFFECIIPRRIAIRRLKTRYVQRKDISQAKPEYFDRLKSRYEPIKGLSSVEYTPLFTNQRPSVTLRTVLGALRRLKNQ